MKRNLATIDLETGEIIEGVYANTKTKFNPWREGYIMTARYGSKFLALDKEINGVTHRVLRVLESELDYENWLQICLKDVADYIGINQTQISRAIKLLTNKGLILKGKKVGRNHTYRLNPEFCWKGDSRKQPKTLYDIPSSEYTEFRRACQAQDAAEERKRQGLEAVQGGVLIDFQEEQQKRKKVQKIAEEIISSGVDLNELQDFLRKSRTR